MRIGTTIASTGAALAGWQIGAAMVGRETDPYMITGAVILLFAGAVVSLFVAFIER